MRPKSPRQIVTAPFVYLILFLFLGIVVHNSAFADTNLELIQLQQEQIELLQKQIQILQEQNKQLQNQLDKIDSSESSNQKNPAQNADVDGASAEDAGTREIGTPSTQDTLADSTEWILEMAGVGTDEMGAAIMFFDGVFCAMVASNHFDNPNPEIAKVARQKAEEWLGVAAYVIEKEGLKELMEGIEADPMRSMLLDLLTHQEKLDPVQEAEFERVMDTFLASRDALLRCRDTQPSTKRGVKKRLRMWNKTAKMMMDAQYQERDEALANTDSLLGDMTTVLIAAFPTK